MKASILLLLFFPSATIGFTSQHAYNRQRSILYTRNVHSTKRSFSSSKTLLYLKENDQSCTTFKMPEIPQIHPTLLPIFLSMAIFIQPDPAVAKDELFKPNPLTNSLLEQIRIWDQDYADNVKYGGELAPGSPKGRDAYAKLLIPILSIENDINRVDDLIHESNGVGLVAANDLLSKEEFKKVNFKKIFNAFADNIYYSDPDRANVYLGGGATPKNEQSIAYLLRNDVLTNIENLQAEVTYLIKEQKAGNALELDDLYTYTSVAKDGMKKYMDLVPPTELKSAKGEFMNSMN